MSALDELDAGMQTPPTAEERPGEADAEAPAPEQEQQVASPDQDLEQLLQRPEVQQLIERRAQNLVGNRLQQQQQEEAEYQQALAYYQRLEEDDDFFAAEVEKHGKAKVLRWVADFEEYRERREKAPLLEPALAELREQFNIAAVQSFKGYLQKSGLLNRLPEEQRSVLQNLRADSDRPWIEAAFEAIVQGLNAVTGNSRTAQKAAEIQQAFQSQEGGPIPSPSRNRAAVDPRRIVEEYAYGKGGWTLDDFEWARRQLGQDY